MLRVHRTHIIQICFLAILIFCYRPIWKPCQVRSGLWASFFHIFLCAISKEWPPSTTYKNSATSINTKQNTSWCFCL